MSALCQIITVYSAKHGIIRCISVKISNESEESHRHQFFLLSRHADAFKISKAFIIISRFFFRVTLSFEPSEPPSLICLLQVPRNCLYLKRKHPCGSPAALKRKDLLLRRPYFLPIMDTAPLSSHPEDGFLNTLRQTQGLIANTHSAEKSVEVKKSREHSPAPALSGELCSPRLSVF